MKRYLKQKLFRNYHRKKNNFGKKKLNTSEKINYCRVSFKDEKRRFRVTTFNRQEAELLKEFSALLGSHFNESHHLQCAHNGKEFDFPFIASRMLIHSIPLPKT